MTDRTFSLPDDLADYVVSRVNSGDFSDADEFMRKLVGDDQRRRDELLVLLDESEASGVSPHGFDEIVEQARAEWRSRAA